MSIMRGISEINQDFRDKNTIFSICDLQLFFTAGLAFYGQAGLFFGHDTIKQKHS